MPGCPRESSTPRERYVNSRWLLSNTGPEIPAPRTEGSGGTADTYIVAADVPSSVREDGRVGSSGRPRVDRLKRRSFTRPGAKRMIRTSGTALPERDPGRKPDTSSRRRSAGSRRWRPRQEHAGCSAYHGPRCIADISSHRRLPGRRARQPRTRPRSAMTSGLGEFTTSHTRTRRSGGCVASTRGP